jgi:acyl transferase domain-containing protein
MPNQNHVAAFERFMALMDQGKAAIERRDLVSVEALEQQVTDLTAELQRIVDAAAASPSTMTGMETPMRQALEQVTLNQKRLTAWIHETGAELGKLQQGAVAVRRYGASVPSGSTFLERRA